MKQLQKDKIVDFLKQYGIYIVVAIVAIVTYIKRKKSQHSNPDESAIKVLSSLSVNNEAMQLKYKTIALQLAHHLGTAYPVWDYRHWTENDKDVFELLKPLNRTDFKIVSELYFKTYAVGNNLSVDLAKMLDKKYYNELTVK